MTYEPAKFKYLEQRRSDTRDLRYPDYARPHRILFSHVRIWIGAYNRTAIIKPAHYAGWNLYGDETI